MAKPSTVRLQVQSNKFGSKLRSRLRTLTRREDLVPTLDPVVPEALRKGEMGRAKDALQRVRGLLSSAPSDHGRLLRIAGLAREALQHEIGNPLTATG